MTDPMMLGSMAIAQTEQHSERLDCLARYWRNEWLNVRWETATADDRSSCLRFIGTSLVTGREEILCRLQPVDVGLPNRPAWEAEDGCEKPHFLLAEAPSLPNLIDILMASKSVRLDNDGSGLLPDRSCGEDSPGLE